MEQAINAYYNITAESEFKEKVRLLEKARHNEAEALRHEREQAQKEIIDLLKSGKSPIDDQKIKVFHAMKCQKHNYKKLEEQGII